MEEGHYRYLHDLLELEVTLFIPATPLRLQAWQKALADHPDQTFTNYILNGIANGFHIGADRAILLRSSATNMPSVRLHPQLVEAHIMAESTAGRLLGPMPRHLSGLVQTNPIAKATPAREMEVECGPVFPNREQCQRRHRTRQVPHVICVGRRSSVWEAAQIIKQLGVGSKLAKLDLHNAYRMVPVHPDDHCLLGVHWGEVVFIDTALPFWS